MKQSLLVFAITTMSLSVTSSRVDAQGIKMGASYTCAGWAEARDTPLGEVIPGYWLAGLMNGLAIGSGKDFWANIEQNQLIFWMDRYCDNNPLGSAVMGAVDLMRERFGRDWAN